MIKLALEKSTRAPEHVGRVQVAVYRRGRVQVASRRGPSVCKLTRTGRCASKQVGGRTGSGRWTSGPGRAGVMMCPGDVQKGSVDSSLLMIAGKFLREALGHRVK